MSFMDRLRLRWALRGSSSSPLTPTSPGREQVHQDTAEEAFRKTHGYSQATAPLPATADISKHNAEVQREYDAEVERRKLAYEAGEYKPRFYMDAWNVFYDRFVPVVNWDLEMTLRPGARVDVTKDIGVPIQPPLSLQQETEARIAGNLGREVALLEKGVDRPVRTLRELTGTREEMLKACNGNVELCDELETMLRETFKVKSLDDPIPAERPVDA